MKAMNASLFREAVFATKKNILYFLLLDVSLIVSLYSLNYLISSYIFDFRNMLAIIQQNNLLVFVLLPVLAVYLLALLFVYTIFKYFILEIIAEKESEIKLQNIFELYKLNAKIFGIFFILFAIINLIFFSIPNEYMVVYAFATMFPFSVLLTLFIDVLHAEFIHHNNNRIRFNRVFENRKILVFKIFLYLTIIAVYSIYNYLGTNGSILLVPFSVFAIIYVYLLRKFEITVFDKIVK